MWEDCPLLVPELGHGNSHQGHLTDECPLKKSASSCLLFGSARWSRGHCHLQGCRYTSLAHKPAGDPSRFICDPSCSHGHSRECAFADTSSVCLPLTPMPTTSVKQLKPQCTLSPACSLTQANTLVVTPEPPFVWLASTSFVRLGAELSRVTRYPAPVIFDEAHTVLFCSLC